MDSVSKAKRSEIMGKVRGKNTSPELHVRKLLHSLGFRYRLHRGDLPGKPDIVFAKKQKIIFVHGCFWHRHEGCSMARFPKSREEFWRKKFEDNKARDARNVCELERQGWSVLIVWECELSDDIALREKLCGFLLDH
ncbi:very short patch repair endonuclease [Marinobacter salinus]|uniref:Very short patch repair endonuclease n=1 Tax=Marinobacter salinus TaxID=1874317 RepID=A0A1D9GK02_9GAMM|nr:very short patch repair endonuclease [Marinobacter salinus]AOY87825.1 very short patch repair endonuclease [Marinobacter salinus]